ncbi:MAG: sulfatase-like hydrolase/transferase [Deltaproteobacteria bacterium]|nr:sulfatase-like hydrolase/transferase [Deltaproteobacteria bacterium]
MRARTVDARAALALALLAFGIRLAWGLAAGVTPGAAFDDAFWYHATATTLASGGGYTNPLTGQPSAAWPPGYPLLLAFGYRLAGAAPATAIAMNALFGALACLFVARLGRRLGGARTGLVAAALLACYPGHVFFAALVLSETLFTCLVCGLLLAAVAWLADARGARPLRWLAWGLGVGAAALVRAEGVVLVLVPAASLALAGERRTAVRVLAATLLGALLALAPWTLRNARVFGAFVPTSTGFGRTFWIGHNPDATGGMTQTIQDAMARAIERSGVAPTTPSGELAVDRVLRGQAIAFALAHPGRELALTPRRAWHLFRGDHVWQAWYGPGTPRGASSAAARRLLARGGNAAYAALGALAVAGWFLRPRERRPAWRPVTAFVVVWIALFSAIYGDPRFHHVLIPIACLLAAHGLLAVHGLLAAHGPRPTHQPPAAGARTRTRAGRGGASPPAIACGPTTTLFACSGAAAVVVALANVASLALARDVARIRDLRPLAALRVALDALDVPFLAGLPTLVHAPFDLHTAPALALFAAPALLGYLACAWIVAALAAPAVVPLARRIAGAPGRTPRGLPTAVLTAPVAPIAAHRLALWTDADGRLVAAASLALAAAAWLVARRLVAAAAAGRLVAACRGAALAGLAWALVGTPLAVRAARPHDVRPAAPAGAPNVVLVSIDTLRPDHLGCYGYVRATSPTIDALAAAGARFTTVVSPTSWTLPAHLSLLTALPPEIHGVSEDRFRLGPGVVTLAEILQRQGYATAGFVSGPYLDAGYGFARGFDHYDDYSAVRVAPAKTHRGHTSPALNAAVAGWLADWKTARPARPFFVFLHMWDAHYDFNPPPPYDTLFDPDYRGRVTGDDFETGAQVHAGMDARDLAHVVALYDGDVRFTDEWLGRILAEVERVAPPADTLVIVTSDHGEEFFEHGRKGHHKALFDESIRVPLVVRYPPRVAAGATIDAQVRLLDVAPTLLALAGLPTPPGFGAGALAAEYAGRDVSSLLVGGPPGFLPAVPAFAGLQPFDFAAVRTETHKLMTGFFDAPAERLFDLRIDAGERHDVAPSARATADALRSTLALWRRGAADAARAADAAALGAEHEAALRALGYVE